MRNTGEMESEVAQCYQELVLSVEIAKRGGTEWFRRRLAKQGLVVGRRQMASDIWRNGLTQMCEAHGQEVLLDAMGEVFRYFIIHGDMPYASFTGGGQRSDGSRVPLHLHYVAPPPAT